MQTRILLVLKEQIKKIVNILGYDIIRVNNDPAKNLLGLHRLPIKTIIDVGANEGQFAKNIVKIFPEATLYCFEPIPNVFKKLNKWAERESKGRVKVYNFALGNKEGDFEMFCHTEHTPSSSLLNTTQLCENIYPFTKSQNSILVKMTTLDRWANLLSSSMAYEILIKLDVQGYEDRVIKGGIETFKKTKACILEINFDKLYEEQAEFKELCDMLYTLGFKYAGNFSQYYAQDGHVIFIDALFIKK